MKFTRHHKISKVGSLSLVFFVVVANEISVVAEVLANEMKVVITSHNNGLKIMNETNNNDVD